MFARHLLCTASPLNLMTLATKPLTTRDIVPVQETLLSGKAGHLVNRRQDFSLEGREAWIFISIKNREFNRPYVNWFIEMCEEHGLKGHICRVDDPYRYNRMAELGTNTLDQAEIDKIDRLSADIGRMVQKGLNGSRTTVVDMVAWKDIADETPAAYHAELRAAYEKPGLVRSALNQHVQSMKPVTSEEELERYAEFFLCEVPILFHAYYCNGSTIDIYPGSQPEFFWEIEMGLFAEELPLLTALTRSERSMLYFDTEVRSKD